MRWEASYEELADNREGRARCPSFGGVPLSAYLDVEGVRTVRTGVVVRVCRSRWWTTQGLAGRQCPMAAWLLLCSPISSYPLRAAGQSVTCMACVRACVRA